MGGGGGGHVSTCIIASGIGYILSHPLMCSKLLFCLRPPAAAEDQAQLEILLLEQFQTTQTSQKYRYFDNELYLLACWQHNLISNAHTSGIRVCLCVRVY